MADYTYGNLDPRYVDAIRQFEGFTPRAKWDVRQNSNGYGTRARYPGEVIDKAEAERRLHEELTRAAGIVDSYASNLDPGTRAALASLTYNSGGDWMKAGLGQAVRAGDWDAARQSFGQYTKAGGQHLPGLANRRNAELGWFGAGAGATQPAQGQPQPGPVQATYPFPAPMALGAPREPVQAPSEVLAQNYGSGAPQPSSALQWDTGAFWAGKAAESKADGGPVPTADEILAEYSDPVEQFHHKLLEKAPIVPPWDRPGTKSPVTGTMSNPPDRPSDWAVKSGVAETVSPTMGAYGVGSILGEVAGATKAGNLGEAGMNALPLGAMFLGPGAKTANKTNMLRAQEMHAKGLPREAIWKDTGWFQGVDGKWRYEIDDRGAKLEPGISPGSQLPASEAFSHSPLYDAYPDAKNVTFQRGERAGGYWDPDKRLINAGGTDSSALETTLHEMQHRTQDAEGFGRGANTMSVLDDQWARFDLAAAAAAKRHESLRTQANALVPEMVAAEADAKHGWMWSRSASGAKAQDLRARYNDLNAQADAAHAERLDAMRQRPAPASPEDAMRHYYRSSGEVEARAVEARRDLTPDQRAARPPWLDYDVPESQQIVRYGDGGPQASASGPLDMSPEARKARAEDLGFDTAKTWHHGTRADAPFDAFKTGLPTKNNLGMLGNVDTTRSATFLTDNSGFASEYGKHVSPYHARGNVIPLTRDIRLNFADSIDPFGPDRDLWSSIKHGRNDWELFDGKVGERFKKWSKDNGIDGYRFGEWIDRASGDGEVGGETLAIFDPKNIRSVNAAFDPAHSNSASLMRSVFPGAVVAGGTLAASNDPKGYADGGSPDAVLNEAYPIHGNELPLKGSDIVGVKHDTLSEYKEPWYRALPNWVTSKIYGPDSTMKQANAVRHLVGTENPLNLPGQMYEGLDTASQGYKLGNPTMTGAGLFQAMSSLPIPGFKGAGHAVKQEARPVANALMPKEAGRPRVAVPPPLGAQQESKVSWPLGEGNASTVRLSSVPDWLDRIGVPYEREASKSISDNFGPSLSSYFHIETPSGKKTIRVSDHDYLAPHGGLDFRLGSSADEAIAEIHRLVGRDVPDDVAGRLSAAKAAKEAADRLKDADRWRSTKPAFREQVEAWLKSNGAGYLIENPSAAWAAVQAHRNYSKESRAHALKEIIEKFKPTDTPTSNFLMSQEAKGIRAYHGSPERMAFDEFAEAARKGTIGPADRPDFQRIQRDPVTVRDDAPAGARDAQREFAERVQPEYAELVKKQQSGGLTSQDAARLQQIQAEAKELSSPVTGSVLYNIDQGLNFGYKPDDIAAFVVHNHLMRNDPSYKGIGSSFSDAAIKAAYDEMMAKSANHGRQSGGAAPLISIPSSYANGGAVHRALKVAEKSVNRTPSDAQKEAGNYAKGHLTYKGLNVTIENPKGSERSGMGRNGKRWSVKMPAAYGYVKSTEGYDGDHVDVYLGPDHDSDKVFVVDQIDAETGKFDEHKCFLSFANKNSALDAYHKAFSDGRAKDRIGSVTEMTMDQFKTWVRSEKTRKPLGDIRPTYANGGAVPTIEDVLAEYNF